MIKKYNDFIKEGLKTNEDLDNNQEEVVDNQVDNLEVETEEVPVETEEEVPVETEEEEGGYYGTKLLHNLKDKLKGDTKNESAETEDVDPNTFVHNGKEITFASETESFLVDGKEVKVNGEPIRNVEDMIAYLDNKDAKSKEVTEEEPKLESKSYKSSRSKK